MLFGGLLNATIGLINSMRSTSLSQKQLHLNHEWQEAQQKKQWRHAEELQAEVREASRLNLMAQMERQMEILDVQQLERNWPLLSCSPSAVAKDISTRLREGKPVPLQMIVVENGDLSKGSLSIHGPVQNAISELNKFMSQHYGLNSESAVQVYDRGKPGANFGSSEVYTLFQVFQAAPTIVLASRVRDSEYVLDCWYWGSGSAVNPVMVELYSCNIEDLQLVVLAQVTESWKKNKKKLNVEDEDKDSLVSLLDRMEAEADRLRALGAEEDDLRYYSRKPFREELAKFTTMAAARVPSDSRRIDAKPFVQAINKGIERMIEASFKICSALLCDAHFLITYKFPPKFMDVCSRELCEMPEIAGQARQLFERMLAALPDTYKTGKPLMYARMALAYQHAERVNEARECSTCSVQLLETMVSPENFSYEASDEMCTCVEELRRIPAAAGIVPWIDRCLTDVSNDDLNRHAVGLYQSGHVEEALEVWRRAGARGHAKSMHNLGQVLLSSGQRTEARDWMSKAILLGYEPLYCQGYGLGWWKCGAGDWVSAFRLWSAYIESEQTANRDEAIAFSALILFTSALSKLSESECSHWAQTVCKDRYLSDSEGLKECLSSETVVYPQLSECVLSVLSDSRTILKEHRRGWRSEKVEEHSDVFTAALGFWSRKSLGQSQSLFPGVADAEKLIYNLADGYPGKWIQTCIDLSLEYEPKILLTTKQYYE